MLFCIILLSIDPQLILISLSYIREKQWRMATPEDRISFPQYICLIFFVKNSCYLCPLCSDLHKEKFIFKLHIDPSNFSFLIYHL